MKTAEGSYGYQSVSEDHGDDADLRSDGDVQDWDSASLKVVLSAINIRQCSAI
jgi:hypothetical protein